MPRIDSKPTAALLAAALMIASLAGCSPEPETAGAVAMGRYVEQVWEAPPSTDYLCGVHKRPDGRIALLGKDEDEAAWRYSSTADGKTWQEETPPWIIALEEHALYVNTVHFNAKGEGVVAYYGTSTDSAEEMYRIGRIGLDGSLSNTAIGGDNPWDIPSARRSVDNESPTAETSIEETSTEEPTEEPPSEDAEAAAETDGDFQTDPEGPLPLFIERALLGEDGMVYIQSFGDTGRFDPATGELLTTYPRRAAAYTLAGGELVQLLTPLDAADAGQSVDTYSLFFSEPRGGEVERILPAESLRFTTGVTMAAGEDGALYLTDAAGLYRVAPGGDGWERLLDGALCSLSMPSMNAYELIPHGDKEFLVAYNAGGSERLINYVYSPDTPTLPDSELTIYSIVGNRTVSQAVGVFRQQYPNTLVNIRTLADEADAGTGDDARRTLNTELLAGKGPDLFLLADLPIDSYIEKGVLADLSDLVGPLVENGELLPAVAEAYARDGAVYAVPTRVTLPTLWGDAEAVAAVDSLDALLAYAEAHPGQRLFGDMTPKHLLHRLLDGEWDSLLTADGAVDVDAVEALLDKLHRLSATAAPHTYRYFDSEEFENEMTESWGDLGGVWVEDYYAVANGRAALMPVLLTGFESVMLPNGTLFKRLGGKTYDETGEGEWNSDLPDDQVNKVFRLYPAGGWYEPRSVVGVNAASGQQALARAFVQAMLAIETQTADLGDGFPVNRAAIAAGVEREENWYMSHSYNIDDDGERRELSLEFAWPSRAMLRAVADSLEESRRSVRSNYTLTMQYAMQEWMTSALDKITKGEATARQAAEWVGEQSRIQASE